jgi:hypothetical protein
MTPRLYQTMAHHMSSSRLIMGGLLAFAGVGLPLLAVFQSRLPRIVSPLIVLAWLFLLLVVWFGRRSPGRSRIARLFWSPSPWIMAIGLDFLFAVCLAWLFGWVTA